MTSSDQDRSITDSQMLPATAERVFASLISPSEIQLWWQAKTAIIIPQVDGIWCANWGKNADDPDYVMAASILEFEPPQLMVLGNFKYFSKSGVGPGTSNIKTEFKISRNSTGSDQCILHVRQSGFPPAGDATTDEFYNGCVQGWRATLDSLLEFFDAGTGS